MNSEMLRNCRNGWEEGNPSLDADYVNPDDFPDCWRGMEITLDVEARAKELAVLRLTADLGLR
jgi:UV DNA damage endonuclease